MGWTVWWGEDKKDRGSFEENLKDKANDHHRREEEEEELRKTSVDGLVWWYSGDY